MVASFTDYLNVQTTGFQEVRTSLEYGPVNHKVFGLNLAFKLINQTALNFINAFMGSRLSFHQYKNYKLSQIVHTGPGGNPTFN